MTYSDIARVYGVDPATIRTGLLECGVPRRSIGVQNIAPHGEKLYYVWKGIRRRCASPGAAGYESF
jgi:hypothetical protein